MKWWHISLTLCLYGFFKEYRPSEPFISPYLVGHWKNFTDEQVNQEIYPVGTYFYLVLLVVVFLLTDFLRYKPVIVFGGLAGIATWCMLIWGTTLTVMQILEFTYGIFMASEVAYYTYIYAKVDKIHYQQVTSHTRTAFLLGKASAGLSSQLFVDNEVFDYLELNYLTVVGVGLATIVAIILPSVPQSIYFHRQETISTNTSSSNGETPEHTNFSVIHNGFASDGIAKPTGKASRRQQCKTAFTYLYSDFKHAFTNSYVIKWSIWWAVATCGYLQVTSYAQLLWEDINNQDQVPLKHGYVEFGHSLLGAAMAFGIGFLKLPWEVWGEFTLSVITLVQGGCLVYSALLNNLYVAYAVYMLYLVLYQAAITIASSEVAKYIKEDSYALIFGVNTFFALIIQTVLTAIVINALQCGIRVQFHIYASYHIVMGIGFLIASIFTFTEVKKLKRQES